MDFKFNDIEIIIVKNSDDSKLRWKTYQNVMIDDFYLIPIQLHIPEIKDKMDLITVLHELGHISSHKYTKRFVKNKSGNNKVLSEIKAWQHVINCTKKSIHEFIIKDAIRCLINCCAVKKVNILSCDDIRKYLLKGVKNRDLL